MWSRDLSVRQDLLHRRSAHTKRSCTSSLAAAALDGLFEHPAGSSEIVANVLFAEPLPD